MEVVRENEKKVTTEPIDIKINLTSKDTKEHTSSIYTNDEKGSEKEKIELVGTYTQ